MRLRGARNLGLMLPVMMAGGGFTLPYSVDFSALADGALPSIWEGAAWRVESGKATNTVTEGNELLTDGALENWTSPTNATSWTEQVAGSSTVNQETTIVYGGSSAARLDVDASNSNANLYQFTTSPARSWFICRARARSSAASGKTGRFSLSGAVFTADCALTDEFQLFERKGQSAGANVYVGFPRLAAASSSIYVDNISGKLLTFADMVATIHPTLALVSVRAAWRLAAYGQGGVIACCDKRAAPTNYVDAWVDRGTGYAHMQKCTGGTIAPLISNAAFTYVEGAVVEIRHPTPTKFQFFYNNTQIGTDQTVEDASIVSNKIHGIFSTGGSQLDSFFAVAS
jgi:hypothetical protein